MALINFFGPDAELIQVNTVSHSILFTGSKVRNFAELDYYMYPALCMMFDYLYYHYYHNNYNNNS